MSDTDQGGRSSVSAVAEAEEQIDHVLGEEYEHKPVPLSARRSSVLGDDGLDRLPDDHHGSDDRVGAGARDGLSARTRGHGHRQHHHVRLCRLLGRAGNEKGNELRADRQHRLWPQRLCVFVRPAVYPFAWLVCGADRHHRQSHQFNIPPELCADDGHRRRALHRHHLRRGPRTPLYRPGVGAALRCARRLGRGGFR